MFNAKYNSANSEEGTTFTYKYRIEERHKHRSMPNRSDYLRQNEGCCCCVRHRGSMPDAGPQSDSVDHD